MKVVELHPARDADDVVKALRNIADDIERGEYRFVPSGAVVILATEEERRLRTDTLYSWDWQTHGIGKLAEHGFSARGIMASALAAWDGPGGEQ
jgi:hypothetical protein